MNAEKSPRRSRGCREVQVAVLCQAVAIAFGRPPEERLVLLDRAAEAGAEVAPVLRLVLNPCTFAKKFGADERAGRSCVKPVPRNEFVPDFAVALNTPPPLRPISGVVGVHLHLDVLQRFDAGIGGRAILRGR